MIAITDERYGNFVRVTELEQGDCFIWNDWAMQRMSMGKRCDMVEEGRVPCVIIFSGQYHELREDTLVEPITVEAIIVK